MSIYICTERNDSKISLMLKGGCEDAYICLAESTFNVVWL